MDILKQYYNDDGQIIRRTPDLTTREFYRDVMCRHRFNEMFVASQERLGPTYTTVDGYIFYDFGGGSGKNLVVSSDREPIKFIEGRGGHSALVCSGNGNSDSPGGNITDIEASGDDVFSIDADMSAGLIFRSPIEYDYTAWTPFLSISVDFLNTTNDSLSYSNSNREMGTLSADFYKFISPNEHYIQEPFINISDTSSFSTNFDYKQVAKSATFLTDGDWHIAEFKCFRDGLIQFLIDGIQLGSLDAGASIVRFFRPKFRLVLWGATNDNNKYAIDSGWIKTI